MQTRSRDLRLLWTSQIPIHQKLLQFLFLFCRQGFLLFETVLSFPYCANLTFCFLTTQVIFAKSNSTEGKGKAAENPFHISLIPEWHRGDKSVAITTLEGKQLGIFCNRDLGIKQQKPLFFPPPPRPWISGPRPGKTLWFPLFFRRRCCNHYWAHLHRIEQIAGWQPTIKIFNYLEDGPLLGKH